MTVNRYDGDVPTEMALIQSLQVTGGVHYHYATPEPVAPQLLPPSPRRWRPAMLEFDDEYQRLTSLADGGATLVVLTGPSGIGKTAKALKWTHANLARWPDGQFYADLAPDDQGTPAVPSEILAHWLGALGMAIDDIPTSLAERTTEWRTRTSVKRILLFLDDTEAAAQVRCLLPNSTNAFTVVTSRLHLSMLVWNGARFLSVGPARAGYRH